MPADPFASSSNRRAIKWRLRRASRAATELGARNHFDLLIADRGLPDGDGLDLLPIIKQYSPLLGIALSGYGMPCDLQSTAKAGYASHLVKPVRFPELRQVLEALIPQVNSAALRQMRQ